MPKTTVYSFSDVKVVMYHQNVGQCVLSSQGMGGGFFGRTCEALLVLAEVRKRESRPFRGRPECN